jgi:acyl-CoA synthetase (NDP forming)
VVWSEQVDAVVVAYVPPVPAPVRDVARLLARIAQDCPVPLVACFPGAGDDVGVPEPVDGGRGLPRYGTPEEAVRALAAATRYGQWRHRDPGRRVDPPGRHPQRARRLIASLLAGSEHGVSLAPDQAAELLACYGLTLWPATVVSGPDEAVHAAQELGFPVALKTTAPQLRHRVDLGGVRLDIADADELRADVERMRELFASMGGSGLLVQRMAPLGVACLVRSAEDPLLGPVVSFGLGGDASELLDDVAHRSPPLTDTDVADLVRSVQASPRLFGHRGARPVDVPALEQLIARIACLADDLPQVAELTLNPVVVAEAGVSVLDAQIRLAPAVGRTDAGRRELASAT